MPATAHVIGSGPAGISTAKALREAGVRVVLLDAGNELEPQRQQQLAALRQLDVSQWTGEPVEFLKRNVAPDRKGVGLKYVYGSDFPYRDATLLANWNSTNAAAMPSLARGGFSNVWGSAILPYVQEDLGKWPIGLKELAPHYESVLRWMPISGSLDELAERFPLYTERPQSLRSSRQAQALLADLAAGRQALHAAGLRFGASRLAVNAQAHDGEAGCVYCGLCMYGCPNQVIFNAASVLASLSASPDFQYQPRVVVQRLEEHPGGVRIVVRRRDAERTETINAERVYLAAGPLGSARIMLESLEAFDQPLTLLDSCYFLFPLLRWRGMTGVASEPLHTLAQAFIEVSDPTISHRTVHLQLYTYNDMYAGAIKKSLGPLFHPARPGLAAMLSRMLIVQGYLHSDDSPSLTLTLRHAGADKLQMDVQGQKRPVRTTEAIKGVLRKLWRHRRDLHAYPLKPLLHVPPPGRGFHSGATFPMAHQPDRFQSDTLGRPAGLKRVHLVDSSSLPSIPATTITLSVMANAHRIASHHHEL